MVIHYDYQKGSLLVGEIRKPRKSYIIPVIVLVSLAGTFALILSYFYYNEELKHHEYKMRLVCYYNFPSSVSDLQPEIIDSNLCSHIIVGFLSINKTHEMEVNNNQLDIIKKVNDLKEKNKNLKVMISLGGAGNINGWSEMVYNHSNRKRFIKSVRIFLKTNNLDGIDLDWEYPNANGSNNREIIHFTQVLEEMRMHIERNSYKFLLSVAVPSLSFQLDTSYQVFYLNKFVDFVNVMSYNYHFYSEDTSVTGLNSPIVRSAIDNGIYAYLNVNDTITYYEGKGLDRSKMNVGLPTFGHSYTLFNLLNNGLYSPARGYGKIGNKGFASYTDICKFLRMDQVSKTFDSTTKSPYASRYFEWISFDDSGSLTLKAKFIMERGYGGIMLYSLNADDFGGQCGNNFALTKAVNKIIL